MTKSKKTAPTKSSKPRSRISSARKQKALSLLRRWAAELVQLNYIDKSSGLRHPGFLVDVSDDDFPSFQFSGYGGVTALIHSLGWVKLDIDSGTRFESVHVEEESGRSFGLAPVFVPESRRADLECAKAQLLMWKSNGITLHFFLSQESLNFAFGGMIANLSSAGFSVEIQGIRGLLVMGFENLTYKVGREGGSTKIEVSNRNARTHLTISEQDPGPEGLLSSPMVN